MCYIYIYIYVCIYTRVYTINCFWALRRGVSSTQGSAKDDGYLRRKQADDDNEADDLVNTKLQFTELSLKTAVTCVR